MRKVGDKFVLITERPWSGRGRRGMERRSELIRVTEANEYRFEYVVESMLDLQNPPYPHNTTGEPGGMTQNFASRIAASPGTCGMSIVE